MGESSLFVSSESSKKLIADDTFSHNEEANTMLGILMWYVIHCYGVLQELT